MEQRKTGPAPTADEAFSDRPQEDIIAGRNAVAEALRAGRAIDSVLLAKGDRAGSISALAAQCRRKGLLVKEVDSRKLDALCGPNHQGIAALAACKETVTLDELFAACDFVTVHVPMTDKTRGMIGRRALSLCKKGVRIINYARGGLVDEAALLEALADGRVAAYVTDFPSDALLGAKGVICTPHLGASTPESEENCAVMAAAQTRDFLESGIIRNSVNLPAVDVAPVSKPRLFCIHENVPNVLGSITSAVAGFGLNISDLVNRSRGNIAVSVVDLDEAPSEKREALTQAVKNIAGMKRVRLLGV